jgi:hypothetical protein
MSEWWTLGLSRGDWERELSKPSRIVALVAWFAVLGLIAVNVPLPFVAVVIFAGYIGWARLMAHWVRLGQSRAAGESSASHGGP